MKSWNVRQLAVLYQENQALSWLCIVIFVNQLGFGSVIAVVPLYARGFGVSQAAIGLTVAIYGLARFLLGMPSGRLADRIGRRRTLVLGELLTMLGNLLCGLSTSYEQFLFFRFISGAGASIVMVAGQIILADVGTRSNRARTMGLYQAFFFAGNGFGPLPGGVLAERFGLNVPFFAFAALGVLAAVLAFDKVPETQGMREKREGVAQTLLRPLPFTAQLRAVLSQKGMLLVSLVWFVQTLARTGAVYTVVPVLGTAKLGLGPDQIGLGLTMVVIADLATAYLSGVASDRFGRKPIIIPANLMAAIALVSFAVAPDFAWYAISFALWGVALGLVVAAPAAYAADLAPPGMNALTMSMYRMIGDLGYVIGPLALGWLADVSSNETALLVTCAMFLVTCFLFALFAPETRLRADQHAVPGPAKGA